MRKMRLKKNIRNTSTQFFIIRLNSHALLLCQIAIEVSKLSNFSISSRSPSGRGEPQGLLTSRLSHFVCLLGCSLCWDYPSSSYPSPHQMSAHTFPAMSAPECPHLPPLLIPDAATAVGMSLLSVGCTSLLLAGPCSPPPAMPSYFPSTKMPERLTS